ncbi:MFS transporter [candidate division FCPU426 bacterium]|nr:MFS transporter [candidate division FCPU426 bacterium]
MKIKFFIGIFLCIELFDELVGSGMDAAWPMIKREMGLTYTQIGLCLGLPAMVSALADPFTSLLGDIGRRRLVVLLGGMAFSAALLLRGASPSFMLLLVSLIVFYPASGAFVNLTQASLMDLEPRRRELNMARWTFWGSAGMLLGPLLVSGILFLGLSWRYFFLAAGGMAFLAALWQWRVVPRHENNRVSLRNAAAAIAEAFKTKSILRWLVLIQAGDLMVDVLMAFLALYFVNVGKVSPAQAGLAVGVWTGVGLLGDFLLIPLLSRVKGLAYLKISAGVMLALFPAFLLVPWFWLKLVLVGLLGFFNSGWYAILQAQIYEMLPGRSGTAMALFNISCLAGAIIPVLLGFIAETYGLSVSMWLLLSGPLAMLLGIRKKDICFDRSAPSAG